MGVPSEFMEQDVTVTNPPTLLLLLEAMTRCTATSACVEHETGEWLREILLPHHLYPRAQAWLDWMLVTQRRNRTADLGSSGTLSFRWRGRDSGERKLMTTTFSSGLD